MRPTGAVLVALALLASACTTRTGVTVLESVAPSAETTSSVARLAAPLPPAPVGQPAADAAAMQEIIAGEGDGALPEIVPVALVAPADPRRARAPFSRPEIHRQRFTDAKPIDFGSAPPQALPVHGVDVSRWQGAIDWATLRRRGANFAWIKATEGGDHLDPMFRRNWREAGEAGLMRGAYHFFYWCRTASDQADWFIRNVPKVEGSLPPVLDVEWNGHSRNCRKQPPRAVVLEKMRVFLERLEKHYGQRPVIYTAPDFYRDNLRGEFRGYPFWLRSVAAHPSKVYPGRDWVFWQYSGSGLSHGVKGQIDLNVFNGSEALWHKWLAKKTS